MLHSPSSTARARCGFTIIEIVVILIIIALMVAIVVPHFLAERNLHKAERVKADLITLNSAIEQYALNNAKMGGVQPSFADLRKYLDPNSDVYRREGQDVFGDSYGPFTVGERPSVPAHTISKLSEVAGDDFWSPFH